MVDKNSLVSTIWQKFLVVATVVAAEIIVVKRGACRRPALQVSCTPFSKVLCVLDS